MIHAILRRLARFIPHDPVTRAGLGPFTLPASAQWMESVFAYHDFYYDIGPANNMRLSDIDWRIFRALTIAAAQAEDPMQRCHRAHQICLYWPIMRRAGHILYNRHGDGK